MNKDTMEKDTTKRIKAEHHKIAKSTYPMQEDTLICAAIYNDQYKAHMDALNKAFPGHGTLPVPMTKEEFAQACALDVCLMTARLSKMIMKKAAGRADRPIDEPDREEDE